jgi:hypothetical protein
MPEMNLTENEAKALYYAVKALQYQDRPLPQEYRDDIITATEKLRLLLEACKRGR